MMTPDKNAPADQKTTIERLLNDEQVLVHINPETPGVVLPEHLMESRTVTLRLSRFFKGALSVAESGVIAELLFGPSYFTCVLPWACIWGASSIRGQEYVWAESAPDEILTMFLAQRDERRSITRSDYESVPPPHMTNRPRKTATHLRRVK